MDNKELQKKVWTNLEKSQKKAAKFEDTVAVSFSLISETVEDLYVAVVDGKLSVEPYHYDAYGCEIEASADTVNKLFAGTLAFDKALKDGVAVVKDGDVAKFKALECLVPKKAAAKSADKKPAAKKTAAKKTTAKPTAKAAAKPAAKAAKLAVKAEEKKAPAAAKPAAKSAEKKAAPAVKPAVKAEEKKAPAAKPAAKPADKKTVDTKPAAKK